MNIVHKKTNKISFPKPVSMELIYIMPSTDKKIVVYNNLYTRADVLLAHTRHGFFVNSKNNTISNYFVRFEDGNEQKLIDYLNNY